MPVDRSGTGAGTAAATTVKSVSAAEAKRRRNSLANVKSLIPVFDDNKKVETTAKKVVTINDNANKPKEKDKVQVRKSVSTSRSVRSRGPAKSSKTVPKATTRSSSRPAPTPLTKQSLENAFDHEARSRNKNTDENK